MAYELQAAKIQQRKRSEEIQNQSSCKAANKELEEGLSIRTWVNSTQSQRELGVYGDLSPIFLILNERW